MFNIPLCYFGNQSRVKKCHQKKGAPKGGGMGGEGGSQKTWSDQTHAMAGKSAQPEEMINRCQNKEPHLTYPVRTSHQLAVQLVQRSRWCPALYLRA